jgi:hypothetical protein
MLWGCIFVSQSKHNSVFKQKEKQKEKQPHSRAGKMGSVTNGWGLTTAGGLALGHASAQTVQMRSNTADDGFYFSLASDGTTAIKLQNLADPVAASDAATKTYVDSVAQGLHTKDSAYVSTQAATASADSVAASNFVVSSSATGGITYVTGTLTVDSTAITTVGTVVLVRHNVNTDAAHQGLFSVGSVAGATCTLTRIASMDTDAEFPGAYSLVTHGTDLGKGYVVTSPDSVDAFTVGTTAITWTAFSSTGGGFSIAGAGLTDSGTTVNVIAGTGITVNANDVQISASYAGQASITTLGTVGTGTWQGTAIADAYIAQNLTLSGATIDSSIIGAGGAAAGTFTTLAGTVLTGSTSVGYLAADAANSILLNSAGIVFEGATPDAFETTLAVVDPTADNTITFPDATGTVCTVAQTDGTLSKYNVGDGLAASGTNYGGIRISTAPVVQITGTDHVFYFLPAADTLTSVFTPAMLASGTSFMISAQGNLANATYKLLIIRTDTSPHEVIFNAEATLSSTTFNLAGGATGSGFSGTAGDHAVFVFPNATTAIATSNNLALSEGVTTSATHAIGVVNGTITVNDKILGADMYSFTTTPAAATPVSRATALLGMYDGSANSTLSIDYDTSTMTINPQGKLSASGIAASGITGHITTATQLDQYQISGVSLGSNLGVLTPGSGLSVGTEGFTVSNGAAAVTYTAYTRIFFLDLSGSTLFHIADVASNSGDEITLGASHVDTIETTHLVVFLREDADGRWVIEGPGRAITAETNTTITVAGAEGFLGANESEWVAFFFNGTPTVPGGSIAADPTNATQSATQVAATITGTPTNGLVILNKEMQGGAGAVANAATFDGLTYDTYYGQAALTMDLDIVGLTGATPVAADSIAMYDLDATANRKVTFTQLSALVLASPTITGNILLDDSATIGTSLKAGFITVDYVDGTAANDVVTITGKLVATGGVSSSDINLKKNVATCGGLEVIREMRGVSWDWKDGDSPSMGIIAQEVQKWVPSIVSQQKNGLGVEYNGLIGILINAMNDLNQKVELIAEGRIDDAIKVKASKATMLFDMEEKKDTKGTKETKHTKREAKQQGDSSSSESEGESETDSATTTPVGTPTSASRYNFRRRRGQRKTRAD